MAIEIDTIGDSSVRLTGDDARRFIDEVKNPSNDPRRIQHLERSAETFERVYSEKSANELFRA
jgi:hypothetical protein